MGASLPVAANFSPQRAEPGASSAWIKTARRTEKTHITLFCIPYAGGGASAFRNWSAFPAPQIAAERIQLPGRENRLAEPPFDRLAPLVDALASVLQAHCDLPFALFGHSMGALIAFEVARELRRRHALCPVHLFVSAHRAPQLPNPHAPVHSLCDDALAEELVRLNKDSADVFRNAELRQLLLPLLRADLAVCETYAYADEAPLDCPISAFAGSDDARVSVSEIAAWGAQTKASFKLKVVDGDHFFLQSAEAFLQDAISADLAGSIGHRWEPEGRDRCQ